MIRFLILLIAVVLLNCKSEKTETVVRGKITGEVPKTIFRTDPVNGGCTWQFIEEIKADSAGYFQFELQIEKPAFIRLIIPGKVYDKFIIAEPGQEYDVVLNFEKNGNIFNIDCESELGHDFYNSLELPTHIDEMAAKLSTDTSFTYIKKNITRSKEKELLDLDKQHDEGFISNDLYAIIKKDRQTYYESLIAAVVLRKHYYYRRDHEVAKADEILKDYNQLYKNYDISDIPLYSQWSYNLLHHYVEFEILNLIHSSSPEINTEKSEYSGFNRRVEIAKQSLSGDHLEYYLANYLSMTISRRKGKEYGLIQLTEDFKADFPESNYISHLNTIIEPVIEFHKKADQSLHDNIVIIDNYSSINSLEACAEYVKGKKVFVDVWATWCQPCLKEFEHNDALKELLDSKDMSLLYISIDKDEDENEWKERISFHKLEGYHVRANQELNAELVQIGVTGIPRYLILDEHGNLLQKNAPKPSHLEELEKVLAEL